MGKGNTAVRQWLKNRERFADLFNGQFFKGEQIILPEDLEPIDSEADVLVKDKSGNTKGVQRYRDIVMRWKNGPMLVILGCENQAKVHYAMPVRNMIYDGLSYVEQMRQIWEMHKKDPEMTMTGEEFLSKFLKTDKIYPVITLILYYGTEKWDASIDLYGMFQLDTESERLLEAYVPNYRINLIEAGNVQRLERFHTDLQKIFGMLQYRSDKTALLNYMQENQTYFRNVDGETYEVIREFLHSERILKKEVNLKKEEKIDMCQALEELYNDGVEIGIEKGKDKTLFTSVQNVMNNLKVSEEKACEIIGISIEEYEKIKNALK